MEKIKLYNSLGLLPLYLSPNYIRGSAALILALQINSPFIITLSSSSPVALHIILYVSPNIRNNNTSYIIGTTRRFFGH